MAVASAAEVVEAVAPAVPPGLISSTRRGKFSQKGRGGEKPGWSQSTAEPHQARLSPRHPVLLAERMQVVGEEAVSDRVKNGTMHVMHVMQVFLYSRHLEDVSTVVRAGGRGEKRCRESAEHCVRYLSILEIRDGCRRRLSMFSNSRWPGMRSAAVAVCLTQR